MPSAHTPEWSKIRTLKAKIQTGRCTASGGRVGRELTEEELEDCRERLAQLEQKRDQGIEDRRVAKETHDNTEKLLDGQQEILHAIHGVNSRLDTVIAPSGSSAHHRLLAKEVAKREREERKQRLLLQQGIVPQEGDFYLGTVLIKADALDQVEELRDRDLEAEFSLAGLSCRVVQISGRSGIVPLGAGFGSAERQEARPGPPPRDSAGLPQQGRLPRDFGVEGGQWPPGASGQRRQEAAQAREPACGGSGPCPRRQGEASCGGGGGGATGDAPSSGAAGAPRAD